MLSKLVAFLVVVLLPLQAAIAQREIGVDVGVAVPTGRLASARSIGPSAALSFGFGNDDRGVGTRVDLAWQKMFGESPPPGREYDYIFYEDYNAYSARGSVVFTLTDGQRRPYGLLGAGAYRLGVRHPTNGLTPGVHVGLGVRVPTGTAELAVEAQGVVLLTTYGIGTDYEPVTYVPVSVGVRF